MTQETMTTSKLRHSIIDLLAKGTPLTANQVWEELDSNESRDRIGQALSNLKKEGGLSAMRNHCPEEDAVRMFYSLSTVDAEAVAVTPAFKKVVKPKAKIEAAVKETVSEVIQPGLVSYQVLIEGTVMIEVDSLSEAKAHAVTLATDNILDAVICKVSVESIGTVKPVITASFIAA